MTIIYTSAGIVFVSHWGWMVIDKDGIHLRHRTAE